MKEVVRFIYLHCFFLAGPLLAHLELFLIALGHNYSLWIVSYRMRMSVVLGDWAKTIPSRRVHLLQESSWGVGNRRGSCNISVMLLVAS